LRKIENAIRVVAPSLAGKLQNTSRTSKATKINPGTPNSDRGLRAGFALFCRDVTRTAISEAPLSPLPSPPPRPHSEKSGRNRRKLVRRTTSAASPASENSRSATDGSRLMRYIKAVRQAAYVSPIAPGIISTSVRRDNPISPAGCGFEPPAVNVGERTCPRAPPDVYERERGSELILRTESSARCTQSRQMASAMPSTSRKNIWILISQGGRMAEKKFF
jgi:hypothetical protein